MSRASRIVTRVCMVSGLWLTLPMAGFAAGGLAETSVAFGRFGTVVLYAPAVEPEQVVLYISGDGAWDQGAVDMAHELAELNALVIGIDIRHYLESLEASGQKCAYPAADFEALGQFVQKKLGYRKFHRPVLVGYSSGATLAYAVLAEAPAGTFGGAVSLGFCSDLLIQKPLCRGAGLKFKPDAKRGQVYEPVPHLADPWVALHGDRDEVCSIDAATRFIDKVDGADLIRLPGVGHGFAVARHWVPQVKVLLARMTQSTAHASPAPDTPQPRPLSSATAQTQSGDPAAHTSDTDDLPLVEVAASQPGDTLAVLLTGDGGWAGIDRQVADGLAERGIAVIGWDSLRYYWTARTPEEGAQDLADILTRYQAALKRDRIILVGYSFGADVLPFLARRLPAAIASRVERVVLLGPGNHAHFEFKFSDWLGGDDEGLDVHDEIVRMRGTSIVCVHGDEEHDSLCNRLTPTQAKNVALPGGHHFDGDYAGLVRVIADDASLAPVR